MFEFIAIGTHFAAGCTPDGACWPDFVTTRKVIVREVDSPSDIDPFKRRLVAFSLTDTGPVCQVFLPRQYKNGWNIELTLSHEVGHCEGVTKHAERN